MNVRTFLEGLPVLVGLTLALGLPRSSSAPAEQGSTPRALRRVAPLPSIEDAEERNQRLLTGEFDGDEWVGILSLPELGEREAYYEILLRRARVDPRARAFLERLARDGEPSEAAWTARLALRELGNANFPLHNLFRMNPMVGPDRSLEELFTELFQDRGLVVPFGQLEPLRGRAGALSRQVEVSQGPDGTRLEVVETRDDSEQRRVYEGGSIEEILAENPELEDELGVAIQSFGGQGSIRFLSAPERRSFGLLGLDSPFLQLDQLLQPRDQGPTPQVEVSPIRTDKLGVKVVPVTPEHADALEIERGLGLYVLSTAPGTFAYGFGVRRGHVLLQLNGRELRRKEDIAEVLLNRDPRTPVELRWIDEFGQLRGQKWVPTKALGGDPTPSKDR